MSKRIVNNRTARAALPSHGRLRLPKNLRKLEAPTPLQTSDRIRRRVRRGTILAAENLTFQSKNWKERQGERAFPFASASKPF